MRIKTNPYRSIMRITGLLASVGLMSGLLAALDGATVEAQVQPTQRGSATGSPAAAATAGAPINAAPSDSDPIARLQARIDAGNVKLPFDSAHGYLVGLLQALRIPQTSQSLVFSRTSLQTDLIAPWSPRALYFNDDVYIGFVSGSAFLEVAAVSPTKGAVFYTLDQDTTKAPEFKHETTSCLMCHRSPAATGGVAGFTMLSTVADVDGYAIASVHTGATTDMTPLSKRYGGWYVTGKVGSAVHSGNVRSDQKYGDIADKEEYRKSFDLTTDSNRMDLQDKITISRYLQHSSDIVALSVLVHQTSVHNLITILHDATVGALKEDAVIRAYLREQDQKPLEETNARMRVAVDRLVRAMLFVDEAPLPGPMTGSSTFAKDFVAEGPFDAKGRSLRDFDLQHHLFKYPLSFLIYSEAFGSLPREARDAVYRRLNVVLHGQASNTDYNARLSPADRQAILEILTATKPEFAATAQWSQQASPKN
jgi:hypothetical protein